MKLFDAHFHIIDPEYPLVENNGYLPPAFTLKDYQTAASDLNVQGGCIVSGSFQAFDQTYLMDALTQLGANYFGVANIPPEMGDDELQRLNEAGVRGVRFNLKRGGSATLNQMVELSNRLYTMFGWHSELYVDSQELKNLSSFLKQVPSFSIDHLGLSKDGLLDLYHWVEKGANVKATGFGRVDFDVLPVLKEVMSINPKALMFGTDLPSTRAKIPFSQRHLTLILDNFTKEEQHLMLWQNAYDWYSNS